MAVMRDRLRILGAFLAAPLLGLGATQASAGVVTKKKTKKKAKKKTAKKKTKKKASKKVRSVSEPGTVALVGAGVIAVGAAHKLGRRTKKRS